MVLPVPLVSLVLFLLFWLPDFNFAANTNQRNLELASGLIGCVYIGLVHGGMLPRLQARTWLHWLLAVLDAVILNLLLLLSPSFPPTMMYALVIITILSGASLAGRWPTYLFLLFFRFILIFQPNTETGRLIGGLTWGGSLVITGVAITEIVLRLEDLVVAKMKRLEAINQIARIISATIEKDEIIPRLNQAIHEAIDADSHFLALVEGDTLHLQWFYDENQLFPAVSIPIKGTLSQWVVQNKKSLRLRNVPKEGPRYGMDSSTVGTERMSLSWIGTPLTTNQEVIGIVALASYRTNAFHPEDLELLESVAQQAAMVLDNANHHSEAVDQSRRDSMTQVLNHAYFLSKFTDYTADERLHPLSLMMVDIDYFKLFNDTYGHLTGDVALKEVVACLRQSVRSTDLIGRWGGEEFVILLPNTHAKDADLAAARIHNLVSVKTILSTSGEPLPLPTVSIGIAELPDETTLLEVLVHLADQRMYAAKRKGRNQTVLGP